MVVTTSRDVIIRQLIIEFSGNVLPYVMCAISAHFFIIFELSLCNLSFISPLFTLFWFVKFYFMKKLSLLISILFCRLDTLLRIEEK